MLQDPQGGFDGVVDWKFTEGAHLREVVFEDRLDDPQPIVAEVRSLKQGHVAKRIEAECGLRRLGRATARRERQRIE
jgi:hypothetical protein